MIRRQVQFTPEQAEALRRRAAAEGRSVADLVREGVDLVLAAEPRRDRDALKRRAAAVAGRFRSGVPDLGSGHDTHLAEAFGDQ